MPTQNPRVNIVLEQPLFQGLKKLAARDGVSLSTNVRDLVRDALEEFEGAALIGEILAGAIRRHREEAAPSSERLE